MAPAQQHVAVSLYMVHAEAAVLPVVEARRLEQVTALCHFLFASANGLPYM